MKQLLMVLGVVFSCAMPASAQSPEDVIRWMYTSLSGQGPLAQQGIAYLSAPAQRNTYFTQRMVAFFDANDSYGDDLSQACIDFGLSIPGQDYDAGEIARTLRISSQGDAKNRTVVADFVTFGQPAQVIYEFITEGGYLKIDDIAGQGFRASQIRCTPKSAPQRPPNDATAYCFQHGEDGLRLDLRSDGSARLEFLSWQSNGHSCSGRLDGQRDEQGVSFPAEQGCLVQLRSTADGGVRLNDPDHVCKFMMCGQRAVIDGLLFPHGSRVDCTGWRGIQY